MLYGFSPPANFHFDTLCLILDFQFPGLIRETNHPETKPNRTEINA